jgi:peptidoglycan/LPS O-acetylase OafA/YrhL
MNSTPPITTPLPPGRLYRSLDIWRGIACLMVVTLHATFYAYLGNFDADAAEHPKANLILTVISRMAVGVQIFFVISGYCIAATADSTRRKHRIGFEYFRRRFRRIFPPYWAALALTIFLALIVARSSHPDLLEPGAKDTGHIPNPSLLSPSQWLGNLTLTETWRPHLFGAHELKILGPSWTLCYEEQFYLVCGLCLLLFPRKFFTAITIVTAIVLLTMTLGHLYHLPFNGFFFDGRWLLFALGVFVYYHLNYAKNRPQSLAPSRIRPHAVPALILLSILTSIFMRYIVLRHASQDAKARAFEYIIATLFALAILYLRPLDAKLSTSKLLYPFAFCGQMCYSLYLIHWPICKAMSATLYNNGITGITNTLLVTVPISMALSILIARLFYNLVERHFLNSPTTTRPLVTTPVLDVLPQPLATGN